MFRKVLVANRGEIAVRIMRTLKKIGIKSIAVYSLADQDAGYLNHADETICIGPPRALESYLCQESILQAALQTDAEAIHPGFGFLSENASFAARCEEQKLTFIGPSSHHMTIMGDKAQARRTMHDLGVPTISGSKDVLRDVHEAKEHAARIGFPVLLKARSGGGGKGMRLVHHETDMDREFADAQREAEASFGDGALYLEKYIQNARHIEFQILADAFGHVVSLGERECSVQRKNQKLIEEAPANNFSASLRKATEEKIITALKTIRYKNAGTMEFLLDSTGHLYFMEMNTRIQVEHPVTELTTGIDIVEWQVRIAANEPLGFTKSDIKHRGAAIECRINAEDPEQNFRPTPGKLTRVSFPKASPEGPLRIETHIETGYTVSPFYDSMLAKIIAFGSDRKEALRLMKTSLEHTHIEGVPTTIGLHRYILESKAFSEGSYDCSLLGTLMGQKDATNG